MNLFKRTNILLGITFISGLAIMAMEISASRILAPYFGTSIFVWTNIIGIVMVALALGYYYGGRLADRVPSLDLLLKLIFSAGAFFLVIPYVIKPLSSAISLGLGEFQSATVAIFISSLLLSAILFAFPLFLLGMVSPFVIKLYLMEEGGHVGESAGRVSAVSTIGSILGTFLPTLLFIPFLGTRLTINIFAFTLMLIGSFGFIKKKIYLSFFVLLPIPFYALSNYQVSNKVGIIHEDESVYQFLSVREKPDGTRYLAINEGSGVQSVYKPDQALTGFYYDYFSVLPNLINKNQPKKILIIGLCGGTIANQLNNFYGEAVQIDGVEIDQKIINIGRKYFSLDTANANIYNEDGRMFLARNKTKYDLIIIDAYAQELYIPWTLTTSEFWQLVRGSLSDDGLMAINVNAVSTESKLLKTISNTLAEVFNYAYLTQIKDGRMNFVLTASQQGLNFSNLVSKTDQDQLKSLAKSFEQDTQTIKYNSKVAVLTDDKAPVEFMTEGMILEYLRN